MTTSNFTSEHAFKKVLLATDFSAASNAAFQAAVGLCQRFGSELSIFNVFEYASIVPPEEGGQFLELDSFYEAAERSLDTVVQEARRSGVTCKGSIGAGTAPHAILETAATEAADLIVLGTRSLHGFERLVFGSTAEAVLRKANCPVFTVGPQTQIQTHSSAHALQDKPGEGIVLFATDFHVATTEALRYAASFASTMGLPLHCLHVLPRVVDDGSHKGVVPQIILEALQHLVGELHETIAPPICAVTYGSEISNAVVEYARMHHAKLIVLGVRRRSLVASHIPAHIAYRMITEAPCPVLTMAYPFAAVAACDRAFSGCEADAAHPMMIQ